MQWQRLSVCSGDVGEACNVLHFDSHAQYPAVRISKACCKCSFVSLHLICVATLICIGMLMIIAVASSPAKLPGAFHEPLQRNWLYLIRHAVVDAVLGFSDAAQLGDAVHQNMQRCCNLGRFAAGRSGQRRLSARKPIGSPKHQQFVQR